MKCIIDANTPTKKASAIEQLKMKYFEIKFPTNTPKQRHIIILFNFIPHQEKPFTFDTFDEQLSIF